MRCVVKAGLVVFTDAEDECGSPKVRDDPLLGNLLNFPIGSR